MSSDEQRSEAGCRSACQRTSDADTVLARLLARVGLVTPEQRAWAWYDCGNSAYFTTVITAVFPAFFASYAAAGLPADEATTRFGADHHIGMAIVAVSAPILGAYGDYTASRKRLLVGLRAGRNRQHLCAHHDHRGRLALGGVGVHRRQHRRLGFAGLLRLDAAAASPRRDETDRVSSAGYALGYLGGGLLLVLNLAWVLQPQTVRAVGHGGRDQAVVCQRRHLVAAVHDSAAAPGARAAARGRPRRPGARQRAARGVRPPGAHLRRDPRTTRRRSWRCWRYSSTRTASRPSSASPASTAPRSGSGRSQQIAAFAMVQLLGVPFAFIFGCARRAAWARSGRSSWHWRCTRWPPRSATSCRTPRTSSCWPAWSPRCRAARRRSAGRSSRG